MARRRADDTGEDTPLDHWREALLPVSEVQIIPPKWIIPGLVVPGLNILAGPPKTFKSTLVLEMIAAITEKKPVSSAQPKMVGEVGGMCFYVPAEQKPGTLRHMYEKRILKRPLKEGVVRWNFTFAKDPWLWQLDAGKYKLAEFIRDVKPKLVVLDPWVHFHQMDENNPLVVHLLIEPKKEISKYGGALVIVHHTRKANNNENPDQLKNDWSRIRGTSALWGMADAGTLLSQAGKGGGINVYSEFKDYPPHSWTWRPG